MPWGLKYGMAMNSIRFEATAVGEFLKIANHSSKKRDPKNQDWKLEQKLAGGPRTLPDAEHATLG